jgi:superfamily II DNA/RNA helicase
MSSFSDLGVPAVIDRALAAHGITSPFPIQSATLPDSLAGRDVLGRGRTGSGKTYAFAIPVVARLAASGSPRKPGRPRALILAPTRELATQIEAAIAPLAEVAGLRTLVVFGGVGATPQIRGLKAGVDILVACPGRLEDHMRSGHVSLGSVEITVLDEADHMADLGFLPVVRRLLDTTPRDGQRMLFSATLDAGVDVLVQRYLNKPVTHHVDAVDEAPIEMSHHVLHVRADDRFDVLVDLVSAPGRSVVFTRTKRRAKILTRQLNAAGVPAVELHGNLAQNARDRNLSAFSGGTAETLVATDIAARGIHVDDIALVIHADPPMEHKAYLHRSGRTARAGAQGTVITLMTDDQQRDVRDLTRKAGVRPTTTRTRPGDALLAELAPGKRVLVAPRVVEELPDAGQPRAAGSGRRRGGRPSAAPAARSSASTRGVSGGGRSGAARSGAPAGGRSGSSAGGRSGGSAAVWSSSSTGLRSGSSGSSGSSGGGRSGGSSGGGGRSGGASGGGQPRQGGAAAFSASSRAGRRSR